MKPNIMRKPRNAPNAKIVLSDFDNHTHICDIFDSPWCGSLEVSCSEMLEMSSGEISCPNCITEIHKSRMKGEL